MYLTRIFYKRGARLTYYVTLLMLLASSLMPASIASAGCVGGSCSSGITLTPDTGKVGTMVVLAITSSTFALEGNYEIRWSPTTAFEQDRTTVLKQGNVARGDTSVAVSFTIPEAQSGAHYIQFIQLATRAMVNFQFNVKPGLKINPSSARPGATVTVTGQGLPAKTASRLTFDGTLTNVFVTTNDVGSFTAKFTVPDTTAGEHEIAATDEYLSPIALAKLEVIPATTPANETLDASAKGNSIQVNAAVPNSPQQLKDNVSPPMPGLLTPMGHRFGLLGVQTVSFGWSDVLDPSGVTYTLEIADNYDFLPTRPIIRKTGLTETGCALSIAPGAYYWRIKAVDGAGNESQWSYSPYQFVVAEISNLMQKFIELLKEVNFFSILGFVIGGLVIIRIFVLLVQGWRQRRRYY